MFRLPKFIKRYFRKNTRPIAQADALVTRQKLSLLYAFFAWNALGFMTYIFYKIVSEHKQKTGLSEGRYYAQLLKQDNVRLVRLRNTEVVGSWDLEKEKQEHGRLLTTEELGYEGLPQQEVLKEDTDGLEQMV